MDKFTQGFQIIRINAGETQTVYFEITPDMISLLDKKKNPVVEPGEFKISVGASSADARLMQKLTVVK